MFSSVGKSPAFLLFWCLYALYAPSVFAQNKNFEPSALIEPSVETPAKSESEIKAVPAIRTGERQMPEIETSEEATKDEIEQPSEAAQTKSKNLATPVSSIGEWKEKQFNFNGLPDKSNGEFAFDKLNTKDDSATDDAQDIKPQHFQWRAAISQSLIFLAVQHGYAFTQPKTREALKGKFWKDYAQSVKNLRGWDDGGRFFTNYIAHPMQGALTGHIYVQNDPKAIKQQFGKSGDYWRSRAKAMLWTTAWSTQFEIGPVSQASIGNVGLKGKQTWEDIIVTPTLGTAMLVGEDAIDRFIIKRIERRTNNFYIKVFSRMLLNPTRNFSNMLRFKEPWHRDRPNAR